MDFTAAMEALGGSSGLLAAGVALGCGIVLVAIVAALRARARDTAAAERERELDDKLADLLRMNAELAGRLRAVGDVVAGRQADVSRIVNERLDALGTRVGVSLDENARSTADHLARLGERLAVIDRAQANLNALSQEVIGLKDVLANKQARGAYGQGRMEAIVRDGLPHDAYAFQATLGNGSRPDCLIRLPGDPRPMAVDAKFPLEAFSAFRGARNPEARRKAAARVRNDVGRHIRDVRTKYLVPGETQDMALLFVPSEAIYADLHEHFVDVTERAAAARVIIVSPSLLMLSVQVMQAIVRDARIREQAHVIQAELGHLLGDVGRLRERAGRLATHLRQANEDLEGVGVCVDKIARRSEKIIDAEMVEPAGTPASGPTRQPATRGPAEEREPSLRAAAGE